MNELKSPNNYGDKEVKNLAKQFLSTYRIYLEVLTRQMGSRIKSLRGINKVPISKEGNIHPESCKKESVNIINHSTNHVPVVDISKELDSQFM
jgi:ABC-type uncharacterized transport system ATPase subunit